jgi:hypothetical protein
MTADDLQGVPALAKVSADATIPTVVDVLSATVRSLSVSFFIEKGLHKQLRMKRKRKGER